MRQNTAVGLAAGNVLIRQDGNEFAIDDSAAPIHDRAGRVTGAVMVFRDVTAPRDVPARVDIDLFKNINDSSRSRDRR